MADLLKIKVGDILRLDAEIVGIGSAFEVHLKGDHSAAVLFLNRPIIEAAEHIPAPTPRCDWAAGEAVSICAAPAVQKLRWIDETGQWRSGLRCECHRAAVEPL